jgi:YHS domain-containing protein
MRRYLFFMILALLMLAGGQIAQAQSANAAKDVPMSKDVGNKICPVTGEKIDPKTKVTYEYDGRVYNFCCGMCVDPFKKDPQKYIKKVNEETQGKK